MRYISIKLNAPGRRDLEKRDVREGIDVRESDARNVKSAYHVDPIPHVSLFEYTTTVGTDLTNRIRYTRFARVAEPRLRTEEEK